MKNVVWLVAFALAMVLGGMAEAQQSVWLQIEARPNLRQAQERARAYSGAFADVEGFALNSGWYAIVLGPYAPTDAQAKLAELKRDRMIPRDSFVADGSKFRRQYWPIGAAASAAPLPGSPQGDTAAADSGTLATPAPAPVTPVPEAATPQTTPQTTAPADTVTAPAAPAAPAEETPAEARRSEAQLTRAQREQLQEALKWYGYYDGAIDGAFGSGTRASMANWQQAKGYDATGVLTTTQRAALMGGYDKAQSELGLKTVTDEDAGIQITLPTAMVGDPRYDPPFAHYDAKDGSGVQVLLISEPGDPDALAGLYHLLQTLQIVPVDGPRSMGGSSFTIAGKNDRISSYSQATLTQGLIKGFVLVWPTKDTDRMTRVLDAMKTSFRPVGKAALDGTMVPTPQDQRRDLLAGLELRKPVAARTGFFVDDSGTVLTTDAVLKSCGRITVGAGHKAQVLHDDKQLGIALLRPEAALAPMAVAKFEGTAPGIGDAAAVAGFSYGGVLSAPVMTYGTLEALTGLQGEDDQRRLAIRTLPGDAGGPVFDQTGAVIGMLLPKSGGDARQLPGNVRFALDAGKLVSALKAAGISPSVSTGVKPLAPEDLATRGAGTAVLVRCWK